MSNRNTIVFLGLLGFTAACSAQIPSYDLAVGYSSVSPVEYTPPEWDYRFDAQYNSTIKPYLRWYRRLASSKNQTRYPYYYGPGSMNIGRPGWFNPYQFMNADNYEEFMRPPSRPNQARNRTEVAPPPPPSFDRYLNRTTSEARRAWIAYDGKSGTTTIVYRKPQRNTEAFYEAEVVVENAAQIRSINWVREPVWASERSIVSR